MSRRLWIYVALLVSVLPACDLFGPDDPWPFLQYEATVDVLETGWVQATLGVRNTSGAEVELTGSGCSGALFNVYSVGDGDRSRRWSLWEWRNTRRNFACTMEERIFRIRPREQGELLRMVHVNRILGDSLPEGDYRVTVYQWWNQGTGPEVDAGIVRLAR